MSIPRVVCIDAGLAVCSLMASAQEHAVIVAPFIRADAFRRLLDALSGSVRILVITRWNPQDLAVGASDTAVMDLLADRAHARILLHPFLHAKVYLADTTRALVGSANVTESALGLGERSNREVLVEIEPVPTTLLVFIRRLEREGIPASAEIRRELERVAERLVPAGPLSEVGSQLLPVGTKQEWFPSLRNPERLYRLYCSIQEASSGDEYEAALDDLAELCLPETPQEAEFRQAVAQRLGSYPQIRALDEFVKLPRRFGELTDWVKRRATRQASDHETYQRRIQNLIRWLLFFFPERYALRQPHYAEIFARRVVGEGEDRASPN